MRMAFIIRKGQHWHCLHVFSVRRRLEAGNFNKRDAKFGNLGSTCFSSIFDRLFCFSNLLGRESCKGAFEARGASLLHKTGSVKNPNIFWIQNVYGFLLCNQGRFRKCDGSEFEDTCEWPGLDWAGFVFLNLLSPQPFLKVPVFLPLHIRYHILRIKHMFGMFIDPVAGWHWGKLWIFVSGWSMTIGHWHHIGS